MVKGRAVIVISFPIKTIPSLLFATSCRTHGDVGGTGEFAIFAIGLVACLRDDHLNVK